MRQNPLHLIYTLYSAICYLSFITFARTEFDVFGQALMLIRLSPLIVQLVSPNSLSNPDKFNFPDKLSNQSMQTLKSFAGVFVIEQAGAELGKIIYVV